MLIRIYQNLSAYLKPNKVTIIYGPRRVGKTTLLQQFLSQTTLKYRLESGDDIAFQEQLGSQSISKIQQMAIGYDLIAIDEAQRIPNVGIGLKILVDHVPNIKIIATGSASFDLSYKIGEPLVGRTTTLYLYPLSQLELSSQYPPHQLSSQLEDCLIFGSYPEALTSPSREQKAGYLNDITNNYLLKDLLELERVKGSKVILDLLRLIAFQIGGEVSLSELGTQLGLDAKTVARYLDLLEKIFVLINLRGYSRNLRTEITRKSKYYFWDNGVRNAIISNFNPLNIRNDIGQLWENFLVSERLKTQKYTSLFANNYFWRTWQQQEIDFVEERQGQLFGFEFKFQPPRHWSQPKLFSATYPNSSVKLITKENYLDFLNGGAAIKFGPATGTP